MKFKATTVFSGKYGHELAQQLQDDYPDIFDHEAEMAYEWGHDHSDKSYVALANFPRWNNPDMPDRIAHYLSKVPLNKLPTTFIPWMLEPQLRADAFEVMVKELRDKKIRKRGEKYFFINWEVQPEDRFDASELKQQEVIKSEIEKALPGATILDVKGYHRHASLHGLSTYASAIKQVYPKAKIGIYHQYWGDGAANYCDISSPSAYPWHVISHPELPAQFPLEDFKNQIKRRFMGSELIANDMGDEIVPWFRGRYSFAGAPSATVSYHDTVAMLHEFQKRGIQRVAYWGFYNNDEQREQMGADREYIDKVFIPAIKDVFV